MAVLAVVASAGVLSGCATRSTAAYGVAEPQQPVAYLADGTVVRVDQPHGVVVLDNGQMYRVVGDRAILVEGQPVVLSGLQPGTRVRIVSGTPVVYQNGQYVAVTPSTSTVVSLPGSMTAPPRTVVMATPPAVAVAPTGTVRMQGRITDVEPDGDVKVRLSDGSAFEFRAPAGTVFREGDLVTIDMNAPAPQPSALPR